MLVLTIKLLGLYGNLKLISKFNLKIIKCKKANCKTLYAQYTIGCFCNLHTKTVLLIMVISR